MSNDQILCTLNTLVYHPETYRCQCGECKSEFVIHRNTLDDLIKCPWCGALVGVKREVEIGHI
jgi:DNA-directed RNA polymerase subunit RPC12/RpoP